MDSNVFTKVLCKLNLNNVIEHYDISFEGAKPKLTTGYAFGHLVAIPIRELIKQGVSLHNVDLDWFDVGDMRIDGKPYKWFMKSEVDIICE